MGDTMADKNYLHTAYANSADGTDGFTTVYPNLNLIDGTRDFSGTWTNSSSWVTNGTYKGLTVKTQNVAWTPISKKFTALISGTYTISEYIRNTGSTQVKSYLNVNGSVISQTDNGTNFDWKKVSFTKALSAGDVIVLETHNGTTGQISVAGYKVENSLVSTPHMPSASEVTTADWPKYVGTYVDTNPVSSTDPSKYVWDEMKYRVYLDGIPVGGSKLLSFDLENLKADTTYNVQVNQINGTDESDKSESVAFKTLLTN